MQPQRETVIYKAGIKGFAAQQYEKDLKRRQKQGWQLVSCTESGKDYVGRSVLTAIYERPGATAMPMPDPVPALNIPALPMLLSMLTPEERQSFENEVTSVVNRWLARKAQG